MNLTCAYRTDPHLRPTWLSRWAPTPCFYWQAFWVVWRAARVAQAGRYSDQRWIDDSLAMARRLECAGVRLTVENPEVFGRLGSPAVVIGNHMSTLETFVLPGVIAPQRAVTFVVKRSLVEYPIFKHVMRARQPVVVGRTNPREDLQTVLEQGEARLRAGCSVIVFPQTTRSAVFRPSQFNSIGVKLARRAGVPVVPLALCTDAWGNGRWLKDFGPINPARPVHLAFGEPLPVEGNGKAAQEQVLAFITGRLRTWGVTIEEEPAPAAAAGRPE